MIAGAAWDDAFGILFGSFGMFIAIVVTIALVVLYVRAMIIIWNGPAYMKRQTELAETSVKWLEEIAGHLRDERAEKIEAEKIAAADDSVGFPKALDPHPDPLYVVCAECGARARVPVGSKLKAGDIAKCPKCGKPVKIA